MPENVRALLVILLASFAASHVARPALSGLIDSGRLIRWRNAWMLMSALAFLSPTIWIFFILASLYLRYLSRQEPATPALYVLLLCAIPPLGFVIPGFGIINYLVQIDYLRLLSLIVLLPAALQLRRESDRLAFGQNWPDRLLIGYLALSVGLQLRDSTVTDTLRQGVYSILDVFLPYYVMSRGLQKFEQFRETLSAFVYAASMIALIAGFEFFKHWLLYKSISANWDIPASNFYLDRGSSLRAVAAMISPIALGYVMVVALGLFVAISPAIPDTRTRRRIWLMLALGLLFPLSRGPWVGAGLMLVVLLATGPNAVKRLFMLAVLGAASIPLLSFLPGGEKILNLLPFIGHIDQQNVDYRHDLIEKSMIVIRRNLLFGSVNFLQTPEMQSLIQGQGIIDLVNTYIGIALGYGLVGVSLFAGFFASIVLPLLRRNDTDTDAATALLRRSLLAVLLAILLMIFTVSPIGVISYLYWTVAGIGVACLNLGRATERAPHHGVAQNSYV